MRHDVYNGNSISEITRYSLDGGVHDDQGEHNDKDIAIHTGNSIKENDDEITEKIKAQQVTL